MRADLGLLRLPARALRSPAYALQLAGDTARAARAALGMLRLARPVHPVNAPLSPSATWLGRRARSRTCSASGPPSTRPSTT